MNINKKTFWWCFFNALLLVVTKTSTIIAWYGDDEQLWRGVFLFSISVMRRHISFLLYNLHPFFVHPWIKKEHKVFMMLNADGFFLKEIEKEFNRFFIYF